MSREIYKALSASRGVRRAVLDLSIAPMVIRSDGDLKMHWTRDPITCADCLGVVSKSGMVFTCTSCGRSCVWAAERLK
jgi:hypothetical protein